jgi:hypothetical protein
MQHSLRSLTSRTRLCLSVALTLGASMIVTVGHRSEAFARNNTNQWDEECWFEGCDSEEREEMWYNGSGLEEGINEQLNKTSFSAVFEVTELASPGASSSVAWGYCTLMMEDLNHMTTIRAIQIHDDCSLRWSQGAHRNH